MIIVYNYGRFRMAGHGSLSGLMPYGDANAIGQTGFSYDWANRLTSVDLPNTFSTAVPTFAWRLDGLVGSRTWSGTGATFGYDAAKRPTSITKGSLSLSQTYDRDGNVTSESRSLTGVTGDAGSATQSWTPCSRADRSAGDSSECEMARPDVIRLSSPGRTSCTLPTLSRCRISPSSSQLTV